MSISVFDLFKIGIGPSSSHTVGPMKAAGMFVAELADTGTAPRVGALRVELFGSLGATGHGHGSVGAVILGLLGHTPEQVEPGRRAGRDPSRPGHRQTRPARRSAGRLLGR